MTTKRNLAANEWKKRNPDRWKIIASRARAKAKRECLEAYSKSPAECCCCGENQIIFLTIDHIEGDGSKHRRDSGIHGGNEIYIWLRKNNFPPGFQTLCFNCNWAKSHGGCPHQIT